MRIKQNDIDKTVNIVFCSLCLFLFTVCPSLHKGEVFVFKKSTHLVISGGGNIFIGVEMKWERMGNSDPCLCVFEQDFDTQTLRGEGRGVTSQQSKLLFLVLTPDK